MAIYQNREAFIPFSRTDLIEICLQDNRLPIQEHQHFRDFCTILTAYYHFKFHKHLELLKKTYTAFNPDDIDTHNISNFIVPNLNQEKEKLISVFKHLLEKANYTPISETSLQRCFQEKSLLKLKTNVNFNDFTDIVCYCRGDIYKNKNFKKFYFWKTTKTFNFFQRVAVLIKFKDKKYFLSQGKKLDELNFQPGKIYVYLYKNIPKFDLEFLFPNVQISMTWQDRLLFGLPAVGAAVPMVWRIIPHILLIIGIILYVTLGHVPVIELEVDREDIKNLMPILVAMLSIIVTCGGFAFKQYMKYKSKQIKFQKDVTETLFYRQIAKNLGVFHSLIDTAEEECKEIILVYYHLLVNKNCLTLAELDDIIENWMTEKLNAKIDFDIQDAVDKLKEIKDDNNQSLVSCDSAGCYSVIPLSKARKIIDSLWDRVFNFT